MRKKYVSPQIREIEIESLEMIAASGNVSVGGWGNGGSLGGGEAEEGVAVRRGTWVIWGDLWSDNQPDL